MFNKSKSFYIAEIVVLVSVRAPKEYSFLAAPSAIADKAAQINLDREFRTNRKDGKPKQPGPVWMGLLYAAAVTRRRQKSFDSQRARASQTIPR
jgi:hypothetical protein